MHTLSLIINLLASLASVIAAVLALTQPARLSHSAEVGPGERFYVYMYAARAIPFGLTAGLLPFWSGGPTAAWVLFTAAVIQGLDAIIAGSRRDRGMVIGASLGALIHALVGFSLV